MVIQFHLDAIYLFVQAILNKTFEDPFVCMKADREMTAQCLKLMDQKVLDIFQPKGAFILHRKA